MSRGSDEKSLARRFNAGIWPTTIRESRQRRKTLPRDYPEVTARDVQQTRLECDSCGVWDLTRGWGISYGPQGGKDHGTFAIGAWLLKTAAHRRVFECGGLPRFFYPSLVTRHLSLATEA